MKKTLTAVLAVILTCTLAPAQDLSRSALSAGIGIEATAPALGQAGPVGFVGYEFIASDLLGIQARLSAGQARPALDGTSWSVSHASAGVDAAFTFLPGHTVRPFLTAGPVLDLRWKDNAHDDRTVTAEYNRKAGDPDNVYNAPCSIFSFGVGVGAGIKVAVSKQVAITAALRDDLMSDRYDGLKQGGPDHRLSTTVGISVRLGKAKNKAKAPFAVYIADPVIKTVTNTVHVTDTLNVVVHDTVTVIKEVPAEIRRTMQDVSALFDTDKDALRPEAIVALDKVVGWLQRNPNLKVEVSGYTDSLGSDEYNLSLSERRARSVYRFFVAQGIDKFRLAYAGYGKNNPVADNATEEGRRLNRRVELRVI